MWVYQSIFRRSTAQTTCGIRHFVFFRADVQQLLFLLTLLLLISGASYNFVKYVRPEQAFRKAGKKC